MRRDEMSGGGADRIYGVTEREYDRILSLNRGFDELKSADGDDRLITGDTSDYLYGGEGDDYLEAAWSGSTPRLPESPRTS